MKKILALTGGIASGKSTVLEYLKNNGYFVLSADEVYKKELENADFVCTISNALYIQPIFKENKISLDKKKVSSIIFNDRKKLEVIRRLTNPLIVDKMISLALSQEKTAILEIPLLFEGNFQDRFDGTIVLLRDKKTRIDTASQRDGKTIDEIEKIILNQYDYDKIENNEHTITVYNDGDLPTLYKKVLDACKIFEKN